MSITQECKQKLMKEYALSEGDTGSVEVQCAVLTERINNLTNHFKTNHKDHTSKRGLLMLVARRRNLLKYIQKKNKSRYLSIIKRLNLRK
ncbi:MAG: 30S ribosomal protein S15 [Rickettsiaceae bacterium]